MKLTDLISDRSVRLGALLAALGTGVLLGNVAVVAALTEQQTIDSRIVNLSGRQRMLSQRIAKASLALTSTANSDRVGALTEEIEVALADWEAADRVLRGESATRGETHSNSAAAQALLLELRPHFNAMRTAAIELVRTARRSGDLSEPLQRIQEHEDDFLRLMDQLVAQYDLEASQRVRRILWLEIGLLAGIGILLIVGVCVLVVWSVRAAHENRARDRAMRDRLRQATIEKERAQRSMLQCSELERERFGQELHDSVCQILTGVQMMLKSGADMDLQTLESLLSQASEQAHRLAHGTESEVLESRGLRAALEQMAGGFASAYSTEVSTDLTGDADDLPPARALHFFRVAQEALSNACRHAAATSVALRLTTEGDRVMLTVTDDGTGFDRAAVEHGLGLTGMEMRASLLGGSVVVNTSSGRGTEVRFEAPRSAPHAVNALEEAYAH